MTIKNVKIIATKSTLIAAVAVTLNVFSFNAVSQQFEDASSLDFGGFDFTPTIDIGLHYDDNLTKTSDNQIDSWSRVISPEFNLQSSYGANQVNFGYRLRNEDYFSSENDNYTDHFFIADVDLEFDARNRLQIALQFEDGHDERGSSFSIGSGRDLSEPDQYKQSEFDVLYKYGAFNSDGSIEINYNLRDLDYDIGTPRYLARDRQISRLGGVFTYRIGATTDITFDIRQSEVDYKYDLNSLNTLDSTIREYLIGLQWEATAKTSGFVKVGYEQKDFDSDLREDFGDFDWKAGVLWEPTEYASLELVTGADTDETNGEGNFILGRTHSLEWRHEWLERLRSKASINVNNNRYEGNLLNGFSVRSDDNISFDAAVYYQFRRWLNFEVAYRYSERDSNRDLIDFDRNQVFINALITL